MRRFETKRIPNALLAFGRRVTAGDAFEDLVAARGWQMETWQPTFVESCERDRPAIAPHETPCGSRDTPWDYKQVLRRTPEVLAPDDESDSDPEARIMVASASDLPSLYFVEWHYIDFVMSCLGNVSEAARVLGVRRLTLQRKRKKNPPTR